MIALLLVAAIAASPTDQTCRVKNAKGVVVRSETRKRAFMKATGYPKGRPGFVVDHVVALSCGGCDVPSNMAWQTVEDAKAKDRWEGDCGRWRDGSYLRLLQGAIDGGAK